MLTVDGTLLTLVALLALWPAALVAIVWRLTNSAGKLEWESRTTEPGQSVAKIRRERDEARGIAAKLRDELERKGGT